jgi:hypothetical protein
MDGLYLVGEGFRRRVSGPAVPDLSLNATEGLWCAAK